MLKLQCFAYMAFHFAKQSLSKPEGWCLKHSHYFHAGKVPISLQLFINTELVIQIFSVNFTLLTNSAFNSQAKLA